jgi:molybdopterin-guanine dinucleotide biosynthesis protein A
LVLLDAQPLIAHVVKRFAPQVDTLVISANRNQAQYRIYAKTVVRDAHDNYAGPLAGIAAALAVTQTPYLAIVPCDSPLLPPDLVARLAGALAQCDASIAVARTADGLQPVYALIASHLAASLAGYLEAGGRKIDRWYTSAGVIEVEFTDADAFLNVNTSDDLARYARLRRRPPSP